LVDQLNLAPYTYNRLSGEAVVPLPSRHECLALMADHGMLSNIREHSFMVMHVALTLGEALVAAGFPLSLPLLEAGALLHDIGKTPCLGTGANHAEWGAVILEGRGYPQVARIVREHAYPAPDPGSLGEAEVVNYADKRVLHHQVVTLAERFADLENRYCRTPESLARLAVLAGRVRAMEERLFAPLSLTPEDLLELNHLRREP
jgi:uncharacterized protein